MQVKLIHKLPPMLSKTILHRASFAKYDHTDALNFKSLLTEDEHIVYPHLFRSSTQPNNSHRHTSSPEYSMTTGQKPSTEAS